MSITRLPQAEADRLAVRSTIASCLAGLAALVLVAVGTRLVMGVLRKRRAVQPTTPT
jgi:hypothetical protein